MQLCVWPTNTHVPYTRFEARIHDDHGTFTLSAYLACHWHAGASCTCSLHASRSHVRLSDRVRPEPTDGTSSEYVTVVAIATATGSGRLDGRITMHALLDTAPSFSWCLACKVCPQGMQLVHVQGMSSKRAANARLQEQSGGLSLDEVKERIREGHEAHEVLLRSNYMLVLKLVGAVQQMSGSGIPEEDLCQVGASSLPCLTFTRVWSWSAGYGHEWPILWAVL